MKLILHIVWKDFLRLRGWLGCWALLLVAEVGIGWLVRSGEWSGAWHRLVKAMGFLAGLKSAIVFLLTLLLVQEDPLAGARQFWITRPLSGTRLLAAKWLGVVLIFGGLPVLVALPWWLSCGFGIREVAWASVEIIGLHVLVALPAMMVASLADSLQRALLWTLVLLAAALSGAAMWGLFVVQDTGSQNMDVAWSRTWIALTVLALGAGVAVVVQFLMRRVGRALGIFGGSLALAVLIAGWWPARWSSESKPTEANAERAAAVTLDFVKASAWLGSAGNGVRDAEMSVDMIARGLPLDQWLEGIDGSIHSWRWPGGPALVREGWLSVHYFVEESFPMRAALGLHDEQKDAETEGELLRLWQKRRDSVEDQEMRKKLGLAPLTAQPPSPPPASTNRDLTASARVPRSLAARMRTDPPAYEAHEWMRLIRPELWFDMPLRTGDWQRRGTHRMRVVHTERFTEGNPNWRFSDQLKLTFAEIWPTTWKDDWKIVYFPRGQWDWQWPPEQYTIPYAVNRSLGQLVQLGREDKQEIRICSVQITRRTLTFSVPKISRGGKWVDWEKPWLEGATLALLGYYEDARFERVLKTERFELAK